MRILLTGASGFTGHHFAQYATSLGHDIIPLKANLCDPSGLRSELEHVQPTHVMHFGAISFVGHGSANAFYDVNVVGTTNLLQALDQSGLQLQKIVLASSATVYGNAVISPISETTTPAPVNHYGMSKLAMEYMAQSYESRFKMVYARAFNYTGLGQDLSFVVPKLVQHFKAGAEYVELGNIDVEREFNDVRMVSEAYLRLLESEKATGTYNLCTGQVHTLRSIIETLENLSGQTIEVRVNTAFVRANEIQRLCGNPTRLIEAIGLIDSPSIQDTLSWMLWTPASEMPV